VGLGERGTAYDLCDVEQRAFSRWRTLVVPADGAWAIRVSSIYRRIPGAERRVGREGKWVNREVEAIRKPGARARHVVESSFPESGGSSACSLNMRGAVRKAGNSLLGVMASQYRKVSRCAEWFHLDAF